MALLALVLLGCMAGGVVLGGVGFILAPNLGISPVLAYSAGISPEAGVAQPATSRRIWGARLKLAGLFLTLAAVVVLGIVMAQTQSDDPAFP